MIFAHIPAGYLLANEFVKRRRWPTILLWVGMLGGTFPDIDIVYSQYVTNGFLGHHLYFTHFPSVWFLLAAISLTIILLADRRDWIPAWAVFFTAAILHIALDGLIGHVYWFAPFSWTSYGPSEGPARFDWWLLNDVFRLRFLLEILIIAGAAFVFFKGGWRDLFDLPREEVAKSRVTE